MSASIIVLADHRRRFLARRNATAIETAERELGFIKLEMAALSHRLDKGEEPKAKGPVHDQLRRLSERHYELCVTLDNLRGIPRPEPRRPNPNRQAAARKGAAARWAKHRAARTNV